MTRNNQSIVNDIQLFKCTIDLNQFISGFNVPFWSLSLVEKGVYLIDHCFCYGRESCNGQRRL